MFNEKAICALEFNKLATWLSVFSNHLKKELGTNLEYLGLDTTPIFDKIEKQSIKVQRVCSVDLKDIPRNIMIAKERYIYYKEHPTARVRSKIINGMSSIEPELFTLFKSEAGVNE